MTDGAAFNHFKCILCVCKEKCWGVCELPCVYVLSVCMYAKKDWCVCELIKCVCVCVCQKRTWSLNELGLSGCE